MRGPTSKRTQYEEIKRALEHIGLFGSSQHAKKIR
jgi:hypothetical protein